MALVDTGATSESFEIKSKEQLVRTLQLAVADEQSASSTYSRLIESLGDDFADVVDKLSEIRDDEYNHIGKLTAMIRDLSDDFSEKEQQGESGDEQGSKSEGESLSKKISELRF